MHWARGVLMWGAALSSGAGLVAWGVLLVLHSRPGVTGGAGRWAPAEAVVLSTAGSGLAATGGWLVLVTLVCLVDVARGAAPSVGGALRPRVVRRTLLRACAPGVGMAVLCITQPAVAGPGGPEPPGHDELTGLVVPHRPVLAAPHGPSRQEPEVRIVRAGDSLWSVAADLLGPGASDAAVDRAWRAVYRANRGRIGPGPDLVMAGTRLVLPAALATPAPESRRGES
jgi:nucleoid-associated protein YgaU